MDSTLVAMEGNMVANDATFIFKRSFEKDQVSSGLSGSHIWQSRQPFGWLPWT